MMLSKKSNYEKQKQKLKLKKKQSVHKLLLQNKNDIIVPIKMNILRIGNQGIKLLNLSKLQDRIAHCKLNPDFCL